MQAGERVAIYSQHRPRPVVALRAISRTDAVAVPVDPANRADEFAHDLGEPETKAAICAAGLAAPCAPPGHGHRCQVPQ